ncbi:MAG: hypothetical protein DMG62_24770, partial [Acidobacteria bacterium]
GPVSSIQCICLKWRALRQRWRLAIACERRAQCVKDRFASYLPWMTTSANGIEEREAKNNHGTCWFAAGRGVLAVCRQ